MKIIDSFLISLFVLGLLACQQKQQQNLKVEKMKTTEQTSVWNIVIQRTVCSSTAAAVEKQLTPFNEEVQGLMAGIQTVFQEQAKKQQAHLDSIGEKQLHPYELYLTDSLFEANEEFISLRVEEYQMLGGANGITRFYGINYQVKTERFLTPKEILDYNQAAAINALLKEHLQDPDSCYTFAAPTVDNFAALNLTPNRVEFTYEKYTLGPGACGPVIISIPKNRLQGMLKQNSSQTGKMQRWFLTENRLIL